MSDGWTYLGTPTHVTTDAELEELRQRNVVVHRNTPQEWDWRRFGRG